MSEYNQYVTAINKIFDYLAKMKTGWNNIDNLNYIESIEEYKKIVASSADSFKDTKPPKNSQSAGSLEELGHD